jgi:hypothetical protein
MTRDDWQAIGIWLVVVLATIWLAQSKTLLDAIDGELDKRVELSVQTMEARAR